MGPEQQTKYTTSFIPKKPVAAPKAGPIKAKGPSVLSILGITVFLISILAAGGAYLWKIQVQQTIEGQIEDLRQARSEFDEQTIAEATRLNERIIAVKSLLNDHVAPSRLFTLLENTILQTVRLGNLSYITDEDDDINITGSGSASGFESVVLQSDEFGGTGSFRDVIFSDVQTNQDGGVVSFSLSASVNDDVVLYRKLVDNGFGLDRADDGDNASGLFRVNNIFD